MSRLSEVGQAAQSLSKMFSAVIEMGKTLETLGALENHEAEINARIAVAQAAEAAEADAFAAAKAATERQMEDNVRNTTAAEEQAKAIITAGKEQAAAILASTIAEIEVAAAVAEEKLNGVVQATLTVQERFDFLDAEVAAKQKQLDDLNTQLKALRAKFT